MSITLTTRPNRTVQLLPSAATPRDDGRAGTQTRFRNENWTSRRRGRGLATVLFSAFAVLAVTGCNVGLGATADLTEESTVDPSGIRRIVITTDNGDVNVDAGTGDIEIDALIAEHDKGDGEWTVDAVGDTLVVTGTCDAGWLDRCAVGFRVTVPAGLDVTVQTNNGDIDLQGLSGAVDLTTNNGEIDGTRIAAGSVQVTSDNGDVKLTFSTAPTMSSPTPTMATSPSRSLRLMTTTRSTHRATTATCRSPSRPTHRHPARSTPSRTTATCASAVRLGDAVPRPASSVVTSYPSPIFEHRTDIGLPRPGVTSEIPFHTTTRVCWRWSPGSCSSESVCARSGAVVERAADASGGSATCFGRTDRTRCGRSHLRTGGSLEEVPVPHGLDAESG